MEKTVFDPLRKKHVALTPEEQVRQFFIKWLNVERGWPLHLMASEYAIKLGRKSLRCDIVAFGRDLQPQMIVECKAPDVTLGRSVLDQIMAYNVVLGVPYLVITNGCTTYACALDKDTGKYEFVEDVPCYSSK